MQGRRGSSHTMQRFPSNVVEKRILDNEYQESSVGADLGRRSARMEYHPSCPQRECCVHGGFRYLVAYEVSAPGIVAS